MTPRTLVLLWLIAFAPVAAASADQPAAAAVDATPEAQAPDVDPFAEPGAQADPAEADAVRAKLARPEAPDPAPAHPELRPVFEQFGGEAGLTALMDAFHARLAADPRTQAFFAGIDAVAFKRHLVEQACAILGGGCTYTGRDMRQAHAGLGIDRASFNAAVESLQEAMDARGIPFSAQNQLLAKLAPMHREIEER
jgi:hemoglobin